MFFKLGVPKNFVKSALRTGCYDRLLLLVLKGMKNNYPDIGEEYAEVFELK